jgi:hypothetical protein
MKYHPGIKLNILPLTMSIFGDRWHMLCIIIDPEAERMLSSSYWSRALKTSIGLTGYMGDPAKSSLLMPITVQYSVAFSYPPQTIYHCNPSVSRHALSVIVFCQKKLWRA